MCGCMGYEVCGYHAEQIERLYRERCELESREQELRVADYERLRQVRGQLHRYGIRTEIVIHQIKTREWEGATA